MEEELKELLRVAAQQYGAGALRFQTRARFIREELKKDCWHCRFCGTPNADGQEICTGCGMPREEAEEG